MAALVGSVALAAGSAAARDTVTDIEAHAAAETPKARAFLLGVPFWLKGEAHPPGGQPLQVSEVTRTSSAVLRSDRAACTSAFLDALKILQRKAIDAGANAIVDLVSTTRDVETESDTTFRCVAGAALARVAVRGTLVKLPDE